MVVLIAVATLAAVAVLVLAEVTRRARSARDRAEAVAAAAGRAAEEAVQAAQDAEQRARDAERSAADAGDQAQDAQRQALDAEKRALRADARLQAMTSGDGGPIWEIERLRAERDWFEIVGPGVELPGGWDGTLGSVLVTEMAVIREVVGTPGEVSVKDPVRLRGGWLAAVTIRLCVELMRAMARAGEELDVVVAADAVTISRAEATDVDLGPLARIAAEADLLLSVDHDAALVRARLSLPPF